MPPFKNGVSINKIRKRKGNGTLQKYLRITAGPQRGKYVHRLIVAARIGRDLHDWEEIDHKDGNTLNDHPSNLSDPMSGAVHAALTNARAKQALERRKLKARRDDDRAVGKAVDFLFGHHRIDET